MTDMIPFLVNMVMVFLFFCGIICLIAVVFYTVFTLIRKRHLPDSSDYFIFAWVNRKFMPLKHNLRVMSVSQLIIVVLSFLFILLDGWFQSGAMILLASSFTLLSFILCQLAALFAVMNLKYGKWRAFIPVLILASILVISEVFQPVELRNILIKKRLENSLPQFQAVVNDIQSGKLQAGSDERYPLPDSVPAQFADKWSHEGEPIRILFYTGGFGFGDTHHRGYFYDAGEGKTHRSPELLPHWYWYLD